VFPPVRRSRLFMSCCCFARAAFPRPATKLAARRLGLEIHPEPVHRNHFPLWGTTSKLGSPPRPTDTEVLNDEGDFNQLGHRDQSARHFRSITRSKEKQTGTSIVICPGRRLTADWRSTKEGHERRRIWMAGARHHSGRVEIPAARGANQPFPWVRSKTPPPRLLQIIRDHAPGQWNVKNRARRRPRFPPPAAGEPSPSPSQTDTKPDGLPPRGPRRPISIGGLQITKLAS